jgi:4-hydroxy-tetrahydrodipicolinate reductase
MKIIINGSSGRMGSEIVKLALSGYKGCSLAAAVDINAPAVANYPTFSSLDDINVDADCVIDFTHHSVTRDLVGFAVSRGLPLVIATTGHTEEELEYIKKASLTIPVFMSANMSLGVALLVELAKTAAKTMVDADIEIIETHHNRKLDAPSGTAVTLAETVCKAKGWDYDEVIRHGREGITGARTDHEIGMHAIRGGDIVGDHTLMFCGIGERFELTHKASSRNTFAKGAVRAVAFLETAKPGFYDMRDVLGLK